MASNTLFSADDIQIDLCQSDFNELKNRCYAKFGYPVVQIEMTDPVFSLIIKEALNMLSTWTPKIVDTLINVKTYQSDYTLDEYNHIGSILDWGVSESYLIMMGIPITALSSMNMVMALSASNNASVITDWISGMSLHNTAKNVFQVYPSMELIQPNIIRISPRPFMDDKWLVRITLPHDTNLSSLNKWEKNWLIKYCTMGVGKFIGNVRRKYEGVALPVGTLSTSGGSIYTESVEEEKQLMEELKQYKKFSSAYISIG